MPNEHRTKTEHPPNEHRTAPNTEADSSQEPTLKEPKSKRLADARTFATKAVRPSSKLAHWEAEILELVGLGVSYRNIQAFLAQRGTVVTVSGLHEFVHAKKRAEVLASLAARAQQPEAPPAPAPPPPRARPAKAPAPAPSNAAPPCRRLQPLGRSTRWRPHLPRQFSHRRRLQDRRRPHPRDPSRSSPGTLTATPSRI